MYTNDEVKGYLAVRIIGDQLKPGWLETGILSKGISGSLGSKPNQVEYVIPLSSTIRCIIDRGISDDGDAGFVIYGESGLKEEKFVVAFKVSQENTDTIRDFLAFRISGYSPHDIARLVLKFDMGMNLIAESSEPQVDYIEYIKEQSVVADTLQGFSLRMPANWANPRGWIPELLSAPQNEDVLLKLGTIQDCIAKSLLLSSWVLEMIENLLVRDPIAACFFVRGDVLESYFWDGPRDLMTSLISKGLDLETFTTNVLIPLWAKTDELVISSSRIKEVIVEAEPQPIEDEQKKLSSKERKLLQKVEWVLRDVDVNDTMRRIERAESILSELERLSTVKEEEPQVKSNHLESRIKETLDRLEALNERLSSIERRLEKICGPSG